jgi:hypothetical protein
MDDDRAAMLRSGSRGDRSLLQIPVIVTTDLLVRKG